VTLRSLRQAFGCLQLSFTSLPEAFRASLPTLEVSQLRTEPSDASVEAESKTPAGFDPQSIVSRSPSAARIVSGPAPAVIVSWPASPIRRSGPFAPISVSLPVPPKTWNASVAPASGLMTSSAPPPLAHWWYGCGGRRQARAKR
jgi:hypothetical protein